MSERSWLAPLAFSDDEIGLVEIVEVDPDQDDRVSG
jgi:hypothetical protein